MKLQDLVNLLDSLDMHPSKKLGQNFLIDDNLLNLIIRSSDLQTGDNVIEIGPGTGHLTEQILKQDISLTAIEYDVRLSEYLSEKYQQNNFYLIQADAGRVNFDELTADKEWICLANLPYAVSTVILAKIIECKNPPKRMILLLQKEMADRIASHPGIKNYGALSVRIQSLYKAEIVRVVPPDVFFPKPDVKSAILRLDLLNERPEHEIISSLFKLVKLAFSQRRKRLMKVLKSSYNKDLEEIFNELNFDRNIRAEQLTVEDFIKLRK